MNLARKDAERDMTMNASTGPIRAIAGSAVIITALFFSLAAPAGPPADGYVVWVADGDTLVLRSGTQRRWIRLAYIDAPERDQPHGLQASHALEALVLNQRVTVEYVDRDRHGRWVGRVYLRGEDINAALVRDGHAWVYRKYTTDAALYRLESAARARRRGLWQSADAVPPWAWRSGELE